MPAIEIIRLSANQTLPENEDWILVEGGVSGHFVSTCVTGDERATFRVSEALATERDAIELATKFAVEHGIKIIYAKGFPNA